MHVLFLDESVSVEVVSILILAAKKLHVKDELHLRHESRVVDLEEDEDELALADVAVPVQIKYRKKPVPNDSRQLRVLHSLVSLKVRNKSELKEKKGIVRRECLT